MALRLFETKQYKRIFIILEYEIENFIIKSNSFYLYRDFNFEDHHNERPIEYHYSLPMVEKISPDQIDHYCEIVLDITIDPLIKIFYYPYIGNHFTEIKIRDFRPRLFKKGTCQFFYDILKEEEFKKKLKHRIDILKM